MNPRGALKPLGDFESPAFVRSATPPEVFKFYRFCILYREFLKGNSRMLEQG